MTGGTMDEVARWRGFLESLSEGHRLMAEAAGTLSGALDVAGLLRAGEDAMEHLDSLGAWVSVPGDPRWPAALDTGSEPVPFLVGRGQIPPGLALGIVGTRRSSSAGNELAHALAATWASRGGWVVSGGALGIDAAAHRGALSVRGRTVVVAGTGLGRPSPRSHAALYRQVERRGAVVSEFPPAFAGASWSFPRRNRIIAGFSDTVVVVEAPPRSGALITARFALKCGKKVLTVPGSPGLLRHQGARCLLSEGALPLLGPEDLPDSLEGAKQQTTGVAQRLPRMDSDPGRVLDVLELGGPGRHLDEIERRTSLAPGGISAALIELELEGLIESLGGGRFRRCPRRD